LYANSTKKITLDIFYEKTRINSISTTVEKGFNEAIYDLSFSTKGRKAFLKKHTKVPLKKSKNGVYYLPKGEYMIKIENTKTSFEVN